jgi:hypothetical protein
MNFIKQLFNEENSEETHNQFVRYGLGKYEPKAGVMIGNGPTMKIYTSFEYTNYIVELMAKNLKGNIAVKGKLFCKIELPDSVKKRGFFLVEIDQEYSQEELLQLIEERKEDSHLLLSMPSHLKIKPKMFNPRGKFDPKYITISTKDESLKKVLMDEFAFDIKQDFKKAEITHTYNIEEIIVPEEFASDPLQARLNAKRKGTIDRKISVDDSETKNTIQFSA